MPHHSHPTQPEAFVRPGTRVPVPGPRTSRPRLAQPRPDQTAEFDPDALRAEALSRRVEVGAPRPGTEKRLYVLLAIGALLLAAVAYWIASPTLPPLPPRPPRAAYVAQEPAAAAVAAPAAPAAKPSSQPPAAAARPATQPAAKPSLTIPAPAPKAVAGKAAAATPPTVAAPAKAPAMTTAKAPAKAPAKSPAKATEKPAGGTP